MFLAGSITLCFAQWQNGPQRGGGNQFPEYPRQNMNNNQNSSLVISTVSQRPLWVSVDNQQYQSNANNGTFNVGQLNSGNHRIIVYEEKRNFWGKQVKTTVYNSSVNLRPGYETTISINSFGQASISERQVSNNNSTGRQNGYDNNGYNNNGYKGNNGKGHAYGKYKNKHNKHQHDDDDDDDDRNRNKGDKKSNRD